MGVIEEQLRAKVHENNQQSSQIWLHEPSSKGLAEIAVSCPYMGFLRLGLTRDIPETAQITPLKACLLYDHAHISSNMNTPKQSENTQNKKVVYIIKQQ